MKFAVSTHPMRNVPNVTVHIAAMLTARTKSEIIAAATNPENKLQFEERRVGQRMYQFVERGEIIAHFLKVSAGEAEALGVCQPTSI